MVFLDVFHNIWSSNKVKWKYEPVFLLSFENLIAFVLKQSDYSGALDFYEWSESCSRIVLISCHAAQISSLSLIVT